MNAGSIRRAQLVSPFGVGAMSVLVNGTSVITAGLDHWYIQGESDGNLVIAEYEEHDWRLEARLGVSAFRLPPDYRPSSGGQEPRNIKLTVPVLRFPRWSFCLYCKRLKRSTLTMQQPEECADASHGDRKRRPAMAQVPFVAICERGHMDDFPFKRWVHESTNPSCTGVLRLVSRGGGGLEGQVVRCGYDARGQRTEGTGCGAERSLMGITGTRRNTQGEASTTLTETLSPHESFSCTGSRPWLGDSHEPCAEPIRGALRAAGNVYFPKVESSIYLPVQEGAVSLELHELVRRPDVGPLLKMLNRLLQEAVTGEDLRSHLPEELFRPFADEDLLAAYHDRFGKLDEAPADETESLDEQLTSDDEWRFPEFQRIRETPNDALLSGSDPGMHRSIESHFSRVRSVDVLRETRALRGFTRVQDGALKLSDGKAQLRRRRHAAANDWLPAYVVKGEGVYLELDDKRLLAWEQGHRVQARAALISNHYGIASSRRGMANREISPRLVLLHTLSHILINQLVFECGYSSASLRERLYVSSSSGRQMGGFLIYTAAGDSEGTMGGLVRMSRPENMRGVLLEGLNNARWCSTDPVCMDAGTKGQGPDSCNLAACHGCALLPETSCEEFNRFLDRGLLVGTHDDPGLGFFSALL